MRRRSFIGMAGSAAAAGPLAVHAQHARKIWRIGMLQPISEQLNARNLAAFRRGLRELGYEEGRHYVIEYRTANGSNAKFPELAAELVRSPVDIIVTQTAPAALAAKAATTTLPIVMAAIGDPLVLVASIASPAGNVTGLSAFVTEIIAKRVELARDAFPRLTKVGHMANAANTLTASQWQEVQAAARTLGLDAAFLDVRSAGDVARAFALAAEGNVGALIVGLDGALQASRHEIVAHAVRARLPAVYGSREFVDAGGLMSYGVSYPHLFHRAAAMVDKIFKGIPPSEIPVEQPMRLELVINLKTAQTPGLELPAVVTARADEVIE